jgi:glycosyltransferase involved in cell wall biosynthesis
MIEVDVVMRSDYATKFGGDVLQVQRYMQHLPAGFDLRMVASGSSMALRPQAIAHVVNVDRPWDLLEASRQARGRPLVISTIHHDSAQVRRIKGRRGRSVRRALDTVLPDASLDLAKRIYRGRSWPRVGPIGVGAFVSATALRRAAGRALERADAILVLAGGERAVIEADFQCRLSTVVVLPNGIPEMRLNSSSRDIPVLIPGRIEPRKNQLALAEALSRSDLQSIFLGAPSPHEERYVDAFRRVIDASPTMQWVPGVPPHEMPEWYARAKVVVNLSLVEVLSLVDLEAYGAGCRLVTTIHGHTREWLGDVAAYVEPNDAAKAVATAGSLLEAWTHCAPEPDIIATMSWPRIAERLAEVYRSVSVVKDQTDRAQRPDSDVGAAVSRRG